jgi:predicted CXXCH cytochrome family protein
MKAWWILILVPWAGAALAEPPGGSVVGSKHDLSASGPGPARAVSETQVCLFCHVPHGGTRGGGNRPEPKGLHQLREATGAASRTPTGSSRVCLSCHDGTIAVGRTVAKGEVAMRGTERGGRIAGGADLGTDLRGSHPISTSQPSGPRFRAPGRTDEVKLDRAGQVQCTSCHDPHREKVDPAVGKFLVRSNRESALCVSCHEPTAYRGASSSHFTSTAAYGPAQGNDTGLTSVAETACMSCHRSHGTEPHGSLLRRSQTAPGDDGACLRCHDGRVARTDLASQLRKPWAHAAPTAQASAHRANEGPSSALARLPETTPSAPRHVTCVDCHDPHLAYPQEAAPPRAGGALAGTWGIDRTGARMAPAQFEYQVCFKCHADSANQPQARGPTPPETLRRAVIEVNLRRVFDPTAASSHPVMGPGRASSVPSLVPPLSTSSVIRCSDCHASDDGPGAGGRGPRGPHGSVHRYLLERQYLTADLTAESRAAYALCYKCHDRDAVLSSRSTFPQHSAHVVRSATPCSACHAAHGISAAAGNPVNNAHLIDFDVSIVRPNSLGVRRYVSAGTGGSCSVSCHGRDHRDTPY